MDVPIHNTNFSGIKPDDKSIIFSEANGRIGNQLLNYALLLQLKISLGVEVLQPRVNILFCVKMLPRVKILLCVKMLTRVLITHV